MPVLKFEVDNRWTVLARNVAEADAGSGALGGVGAISGELFLRDGFSGAWHAFDLPFADIAGGSGQARPAAVSSDRF